MSNIEDVLRELKKGEPIFHHPDKFDNTQEAIESMIDSARFLSCTTPLN